MRHTLRHHYAQSTRHRQTEPRSGRSLRAEPKIRDRRRLLGGSHCSPQGHTNRVEQRLDARPPRKAKKLADILSGPAKSDVIVHKQGRRFAAWFDCAALPRNISGSVIREPIPPSQVGADKVWSGKASGADLRDKGKTVWSVFPGAKDLVQNLPPGDAILEIRDPGGKVSQTLAPHEEAHAKAWKKAFEDVIRKWTRDVASHAKQADAVESGTKALARAKLFRTVGGSKRRIARKTLRAKGKADKVVDQKKGITFTISRIQTRVGGGKSRVTIFIKPR